MKKNRPRWTYLPAYITLLGVFGFFRLLPLDAASYLGGRLACLIAPLLKWHRIAAKNLAFIFPEKSEAERHQIRRDMWDNLGRNLAEYFWLSTPQLQRRIHLSPEVAEKFEAIKNSAQPIVFAGGHFANWEIIPLTMFLRSRPTTLIYRRANNPYVEALVHRIRMNYCAGHFPKGKKGATEAIRTLKEGGVLGMLVDQKMNDGVAVEFLGKTAMTAPAFADLALRYKAQLWAIGVRRLKGVHFEVYLEEVPLPPVGAPDAVRQVIEKEHEILEGWVRAAPAQWLWVHQRWQKW
jgi:KDO2-lipid IV(A) lauroyltransferase